MAAVSRDGTPQTIRLADYAPPDFLIDRIDLTVDIDEPETRVRARTMFRRNPEGRAGAPLILDGRAMRLVAVRLNDRDLAQGTDYALTDDHLTVANVPDRFFLTVETALRPQDNTELSGLYRSGDMYCTQCEAQGFRKITYYLDRPDVLARFTTRITADAQRYPVLLSNGNRIGAGTIEGGRHFAVWDDPFPKPAYLFALVAGDLAVLEDAFVTASGRKVELKIFARAPDIDKCDFAMEALKQSMAWDEQVFGREYDLDTFMIVAVGDFNMGAMENKGLNIFNTHYVLARPESATDADFMGIQTVIAHEYFHNWTGNRITCRDWFQLSLKEGLTVFRDQQFSGDMQSRAVKRIADVRRLRAAQFPEDASPMAHPVRPESYIEINNFYTPTVYEKGAEVVRMMHTLLGAERFRRGMDRYFERHDGQAVTCDDFVRAMEDASGVDLGQFRLWYSQAGTPELAIRHSFDAAEGALTLTVEQRCPPTPGQPAKQPMHIPLAIGLVDDDGADLIIRLENDATTANAPGTRVLDIRQPSETFRITGLAKRPRLSLLRGFSAPVKLSTDLSEDDLYFLMARDGDPFARWEAGQQLAVASLLRMVGERAEGKAMTIDRRLIAAIAEILDDPRIDDAFRAEMIALPSETYLGELMEVIDVDGIHAAREALRAAIGATLGDRLRAIHARRAGTPPDHVDAGTIGQRAMRNAALAYLMAEPDQHALDLAAAQARDDATMTERLGALALLADGDWPERAPALATFHARWQGEALVLDKWFAVQALATRRPNLLADVDALLEHPDFDIRNPNKVRALIGSFAMNPVGFHAADGSGYRWLAEQVRRVDRLNGQIAARLVGRLIRWRRYDPARRALMRAELEALIATPGLSRDTFEIVSKALAA